MPTTAKSALYPYDYFSLNEELEPAQALIRIKKANGQAFLLPRDSYKKVAKIKPLIQAGASLLVRRSDIKNSLISAEERDSLIEAFSEKVFIQGYSPASSQMFLEKGASILIDGKEPTGGMTATSIQELCQKLGSKNKVKVSRFQINEHALLNLLKEKLKLVFSCVGTADCHRQLLKKCLLLQVPNLIITASDFSQNELASFMENQATVIITENDKVPIDAIKALAFTLEEEPIPANRLLKVSPDNRPPNEKVELKQLQDDQKIELLKNDNWYFNTSLDQLIA